MSIHPVTQFGKDDLLSNLTYCTFSRSQEAKRRLGLGIDTELIRDQHYLPATRRSQQNWVKNEAMRVVVSWGHSSQCLH